MSDEKITLVLDPLMLSRLKHFVGAAAFQGDGNKAARELYEEIQRQEREQP
jgi:hypothetical protein